MFALSPPFLNDRKLTGFLLDLPPQEYLIGLRQVPLSFCIIRNWEFFLNDGSLTSHLPPSTPEDFHLHLCRSPPSTAFTSINLNSTTWRKKGPLKKKSLWMYWYFIRRILQIDSVGFFWVGKDSVIWRHQAAPTGVAQLVGCCSAKRKVARSIPGQGTCLGCEFHSVRARGLTDACLSCWRFSPSLLPSLPLSLKNK